MSSRLRIAGLLACLFVLLPAAADAARPQAAIVVDAASGRVLHARHADEPVYPASLTKMMTLYMLFEALEEGRLSPSTRLPVSARAARMPASRLGLRKGQTITVRDAIGALVVKSANDVAVVVAEALGGSEAAFAKQMTRKARALGMSRTTFVNASGLPDRRQRTTARDMATLARRLLADFPRDYAHFATERFRWHGRTYRTHNNLLGRYRGADGLKTGYIRASGYNLVASAVRDGRRVIAVYIGGRTARARDRKVAQLLDLGFSQLEQSQLVALGPPLPRPGSPPAGMVLASAVPEVAPPTRRPLIGAESGDSFATRPLAGLDAGADLAVRPASSGAVAAVAATEVAKMFGVQVGAFLRPQQAYAAARDSVRLLPDLLLDGDITVTPRKGRRKTFYRARIVGVDERTAEEACRELARLKRDCMIVRFGEPVELAAS